LPELSRGAAAAAAVAAPAGTRINNGVMLGSSVGGGMTYIEPAQVGLKCCICTLWRAMFLGSGCQQ
jgi:hypothetical protein